MSTAIEGVGVGELDPAHRLDSVVCVTDAVIHNAGGIGGEAEGCNVRAAKTDDAEGCVPVGYYANGVAGI